MREFNNRFFLFEPNQVDAFRRENKNLAQELKSLTDQLSESDKSIQEQLKALGRLELEKDDTQKALEVAKSALEIEQSKSLRAQVRFRAILRNYIFGILF